MIDTVRDFILYLKLCNRTPEEIIDQVTDEFFTGDVTRNSGHLGLGLSLVKNIISLHEGQVTITSEKGEGTFITIDFPLDED
ncbi:sensor histidine kinase [Candidatus Enterococcus leclercqii]